MRGQSQTLQQFSWYGNDRDTQGNQSPRLGFQYGPGTRVVTIEALSETPRLGLLDRIVRAINSAVLE